MEHRNLEQRCAIKFCAKLGESASVTFEKLKQVYGEQCLSRAQVFRWHKSFLEGREHVEDEPRSGRPLTSRTDENMDRVRALVRSDRRLTIKMISEQLNLNTFTVHQIVTDDLNMRKVCAKLVPKNLTTEQKDNRKNVCVDLLERIANDQEFFNCVITGNESWIFEYDPETKRQSKEWHTSSSPRPKKCRM